MKTFEGLPEHTKLACKLRPDGTRQDNQVLEYRVDKSDGTAYLCSDISAWPANTIHADDYEIYTGDKAVGEYL